jgi:hypothetical protein
MDIIERKQGELNNFAGSHGGFSDDAIISKNLDGIITR